MGDNRAAWTEEEENIVRQRYKEGYSATRIADFIYAVRGSTVTRNAVIGKIHRLPDMPGREGIKSGNVHASEKNVRKPRTTPQQPPAEAPRSRAMPAKPSIQAEKRKPPPPLPKIVEPVPTGLIGVMDLTSTTCRWPIGDPGTKGFHFCGAHMEVPFSESLPNSAYCDYHAKGAYNGLRWNPTEQPRQFTNQYNKMGKVA